MQLADSHSTSVADSSTQVTSDPTQLTRDQLRILLGSVFIIAACSLLYELLISSLSTYLLGSSVIHYSITIGLFLFFMGVGAGLSALITKSLTATFVAIELAIGLLGGLSAFVLFAAYVWSEAYYPVMLLVIASLSTLIGMEIPLLTRLMEKSEGLRKSISEVLSFDYLGALGASLLFPFVLLPYFGHLTAAAGAGLLNLLVAAFVCWHFRHHLGKWRLPLLSAAALGIAALALFVILQKPLQRVMEQALYQDTVIYSEQSKYQKLVVTRWGEDLRLYLDSSLQFSSVDEYRYHETLVHAPAAFSYAHSNVLIIGGGDGLAARELLRYPELQELTIVELDSAVSTLASTLPALKRLNQNALQDPRVSVIHKDAWQWLADSQQIFDLILIDLPDPSTEDTARLYTVAFYQRAAKRLAAGGVLLTQATSPWFAPQAFWSIGATLEEVFKQVKPLSVYIPSFGPWGFFMASQQTFATPKLLPEDLQFLNEQTLANALIPDPDRPKLNMQPNRIGKLPLLQYYAKGWNFINIGTQRP